MNVEQYILRYVNVCYKLTESQSGIHTLSQKVRLCHYYAGTKMRKVWQLKRTKSKLEKSFRSMVWHIYLIFTPRALRS